MHCPASAEVGVSAMWAVAGGVLGAFLAWAWMQRRQRQHAQQQARAQQVLGEYRAMVESANDAILLMQATRIIECNPAAERLFGQARERLLGMHPGSLSPRTQPNGESSELLANANIARTLAGEPQRFLWVHLRGGSQPFTAEVALAPSSASLGAQHEQRFVAVLRDVTESQRASEALKTSEQQFGQLFEMAPVPLALTTPEGRLIDHNRQWAKVLGYTREDVPSMTEWWQRAYPDAAYRAAIQGVWEKAIGKVVHEGKELQQTEVRITCKDGQVRAMRVGGALVGNAILTSYVDVTELRNTQQALEGLNAGLENRVAERTAELRSAIEHLQRAQDELVRSEKLASLGALVAGMAHELNTPIGNAVIVASTLADRRRQFDADMAKGLRKSTLQRFVADLGEGLEVMERNLLRAGELIAGFKQVAVDQSSHQRRRFQLDELAHELKLTLSPTLRRAGVALAVQVPAGLAFDSHPGPLGQVLMNIVNNAVVHAFAQQARPEVTLTASPLDDGRVRLQVQDNGCGIAPEHLARVFDPFFTTRLGQGGSGLGMHIVYSLVTELLGGTVTIDSQVGQGTTVTLTLPLNAPQPAADPA